MKGAKAKQLKSAVAFEPLVIAFKPNRVLPPAMENVSSGVQSLVIPGRLPGLNEVINAAKLRKGKWSAYYEMKKNYTEYVYQMARKAKLTPIPEPVFIEFRWREIDRKRDLDNIAAAKKFVIDGLVAAGVLRQDGWKHLAGFSDTFQVAEDAGVDVVLRPKLPQSDGYSGGL